MFKLFPAFSRDADPSFGRSPTICGPSEIISEVLLSGFLIFMVKVLPLFSSLSSVDVRLTYF